MPDDIQDEPRAPMIVPPQEDPWLAQVRALNAPPVDPIPDSALSGVALRTRQVADAMRSPFTAPGAPQLPPDYQPPPALPPGGFQMSSQGGPTVSMQLPTPSPEQRQMEDMRRMYGNLPVPQAMERIKAATQLQAIWGYRNDVANNVPPAEAFAKWAPLGLAGAFGGAQKAGTAHVFQNPHTGAINRVDEYGNLQALSPGSTPTLYKDVAGRLFKIEGDQATPMTPERRQATVGQKAVAKAHADRAALQLTTAEGALALIPKTIKEGLFGRGKEVPNPAYEAKKAEVDALREKAEAIDATANEPPPEAPEEVRRDHNGRVAIFDKKTKKFLRYAE